MVTELYRCNECGYETTVDYEEWGYPQDGYHCSKKDNNENWCSGTLWPVRGSASTLNKEESD